MGNLLGTLQIASNTLMVQQDGIAVTSHNLANINNAAYARQRLLIQTNTAVPTAIGPEGTGVTAAAIQQIRSPLLDNQITAESSVSGYYQSLQTGLSLAQSVLGEQVSSSSGAASSVPNGIASNLNDLFNAFQSLSTNPSDLTQRQAVIGAAQNLATQFNQVATQLSTLQGNLNQSIVTGVDQANTLLANIASLNGQIVTQQAGGGAANDLLDTRQKDLESLANLMNFSTTTEANGALDISVGATALVTGVTQNNTLTTYDANGNGQILVSTVAAPTTQLALTSGTIQGTIDARDQHLTLLSSGLDTLAANLVDQVNKVIGGVNGFNNYGGHGTNFFDPAGLTAATIAVNPAIVTNPNLIQASGSGLSGDNGAILKAANLATSTAVGLGTETFSQNYGQMVTTLGQSLSSANNSADDQTNLSLALQKQRDSVSGVSLDQEMTNLAQYQHAYEASAQVIAVVNKMLQTLTQLV